MSDERMIRIDNLKLLMTQLGLNKAEMADLLDCSDTYVGKLVNKKASFGEKVARKIEEKTGKPHGWLDLVHVLQDENQAPPKGGTVIDAADAFMQDSKQTPPSFKGVFDAASHTAYNALRVKTYPMAPVLAWARLGDDLSRANKQWPASEQRELPTSKEVSEKVKWVEVDDNSLAPAVTQGDLIAIDPLGLPKRDEVALIRTLDGEFMLRRWRPLLDGAFEAYDAQGRVLDSGRHGLEVAGSCVGVFKAFV